MRKLHGYCLFEIGNTLALIGAVLNQKIIHLLINGEYKTSKQISSLLRSKHEKIICHLETLKKDKIISRLKKTKDYPIEYFIPSEKRTMLGVIYENVKALSFGLKHYGKNIQ